MKSFFCALLIGFSLVHSAARADDLPAITTAQASDHDYIGSGPLDDDRLHDFIKAREGENYTTSDYDDYVLLTSPENTVFIYVTKPSTPAWPGLVQKRALPSQTVFSFIRAGAAKKWMNSPTGPYRSAAGTRPRIQNIMIFPMLLARKALSRKWIWR